MVRLRGFVTLTKVEEARRRFFENIRIAEKQHEMISAFDALGRYAAAEIKAMEDVPAFDRSAMDGYALHSADTTGASTISPVTLRLTDGDPLEKGYAKRVWTGSPVPKDADSVVMLEHAKERDGEVLIMMQAFPSMNVSHRGEDWKKGETIAGKGSRLRPQDIGAIVSAGHITVEVFKKPRVGILSTGDELVEYGRRTGLGQVVDSNKIVLGHMVREVGGEPLNLGIARDQVEEIAARLRVGLETCDLILTTGGTSTGHSDLVVDACKQLGDPGVVVHGVALRPGRPTGLVSIHGKPIITLPGNPAACMIGFEFFARPLIQRMLCTREDRPTVKARLTRVIPSTLGQRTVARVRVFERAGQVFAEPIVTSGASLLKPMVRANGYVEIAEDLEGLEEGEEVQVRLWSGVETE
jgi:molybdopterin molybdotransferase